MYCSNVTQIDLRRAPCLMRRQRALQRRTAATGAFLGPLGALGLPSQAQHPPGAAWEQAGPGRPIYAFKPPEAPLRQPRPFSPAISVPGGWQEAGGGLSRAEKALRLCAVAPPGCRRLRPLLWRSVACDHNALPAKAAPDLPPASFYAAMSCACQQLRLIVGQLRGGATAADRCAAAIQLRCLALEPQLNALLITVGAAPALVEALSSSDADTVESAAAALGNLTAHALEASDAVGAAGAVPALVRLLQRRGSTAGQRRYAVCTLNNLAHDRSELSQDIVGAGGIPALVECLATPSAPAQREAAGALCNIAGGGSRLAAAVEVGGAVPSLVTLLRSTDDELVQFEALGVLHRMAAFNLARSHAVAAAGAIPLAVRLLGSPSADVTWEAAQPLSGLAQHSMERAAAILATGAIQPLVQLLRTATRAEVQMAAVQALSALLDSCPGCGHNIAAAGGSAALQRVADTGSGLLTRFLAAQVLGKLPPSAAAEAQEAASTQQAQQATTRPAPMLAPVQPAAAPPAAGPSRPPRICAAPGCGATTGLKRCGGCRAVRYCSVECSQTNWKAHKTECRRMQAEWAQASS